jgi:hypothetical protein
MYLPPPSTDPSSGNIIRHVILVVVLAVVVVTIHSPILDTDAICVPARLIHSSSVSVLSFSVINIPLLVYFCR